MALPAGGGQVLDVLAAEPLRGAPILAIRSPLPAALRRGLLRTSGRRRPNIKDRRPAARRPKGRDKDQPRGDAVMSLQHGLLAGLRQSAPVGVLLLAPAGLLPDGTWTWREGLISVGVHTASSLVSNVALAVSRPESFAVRQQSVVATQERKQPFIDGPGGGAHRLPVSPGLGSSRSTSSSCISSRLPGRGR